MPLMSQSDYAAHQNVSRQAVQKWKNAGLLVFNGTLVDSEATDQNLKRYRVKGDTSSSGNAEKYQSQHQDSGRPQHPSIHDEISTLDAGMDLEEAKRVKENYLAFLNKHDYEKKSGQVIDLQLAESFLFEEARRWRDTWLNFPAKAAPYIAADLGVEADVILELLTKHIHEQIEMLGESNSERLKNENIH